MFLRVETQVHPKMVEPVLRPSVRLFLLLGADPYIFQVEILNRTIHECYTDTPQTAFSRQISDLCLPADLGTLRCQVAASPTKGVTPLTCCLPATNLKFDIFLIFFFFFTKDTSVDMKHGSQTQHPTEVKVKSLGSQGHIGCSGDLHQLPGDSTIIQRKRTE